LSHPTIFCRFKSCFQKLSHKDVSDLHFVDDLLFDQVITATEKEELVDECKSFLQKTSSRGDYKELIELTLVHLTGIDNLPHFKFFRPGACHKARWMAKLLYCLKMVLLSKKIEKELPQGAVFVKGQLQKIIKFVKFVIINYVKWWMSCSIAQDAPVNDLQLINKLLSYKEIDNKLATVALQSLGKHLWYLTAELTPLSLFSSKLSNSSKDKIAKRLLDLENSADILVSGTCQNRMGYGFGKPQFPVLPTNACYELDTFIGNDSWLFFKVLKIDSSFLHQPAQVWNTLTEFSQTLEVVRSIVVVNDAAERGVKMTSDYYGRSREESRFQHILQVVENSRKKHPDLRKATI